MATTAPEKEAPARGEEFIFVERNAQSLEELEAKLAELSDDISELYYRNDRNAMFLKKFFELFVAFSVLVTPIAMAFVFNHLTDQKTWNFCEEFQIAYGPCNEGEENVNKTHFVSFVKPSSVSAFRQAVIFTLISLAFFVGIPYYYFTLDQLHRLDIDDYDYDEDSDYDSDSDYEDDPQAVAAIHHHEEKVPEGEQSEINDERCEKDAGKSRKNRKKSSKKESKKPPKEAKDPPEKAPLSSDPQPEAGKLSRKQLDNFD